MERLVELVQARTRDGRLLEPAQDSALFYFGQLRSTDPTGAQAANLAPELSARLIERARALLDQQALDAAQAHLAAARQLDLDLATVGELESRLAAARHPGAAEPQAVRTAELKRTRFVPPVYPRQALEDEVEGTVRVRITRSLSLDVVLLRGTDERSARRASACAATPATCVRSREISMRYRRAIWHWVRWLTSFSNSSERYDGCNGRSQNEPTCATATRGGEHGTHGG